MSASHYHWSMRTLHWLMAFLIIGMIAVGWIMTEIKGLGPLRGELYALHKSIGVILLVLVFVRGAVRFLTPIPPLPEGLTSFEKRAAKLGHLLLYLGMISVTLTGFTMSMAGGHGIKFFGAKLPDMMAVNKPLASLAHELHELLPYLLLGVVVVHVVGALKHRFRDAPENDVLPRMGIPSRSTKATD